MEVKLLVHFRFILTSAGPAVCHINSISLQKHLHYLDLKNKHLLKSSIELSQTSQCLAVLSKILASQLHLLQQICTLQRRALCSLYRLSAFFFSFFSPQLCSYQDIKNRFPKYIDRQTSSDCLNSTIFFDEIEQPKITFKLLSFQRVSR